jgi:hypothetical protein
MSTRPSLGICTAIVALGALALSAPFSNAKAPSPTAIGTQVSEEIGAASATSGTFNTYVADIVDAAVDTAGLTPSGQATVVKDALGALSDKASSSGTTVLTADASVGAKLEDDGALTVAALNTIFTGAIAGVSGVKGTSPSVGAEAAQQFIAGIVDTNTLPGAVSPTPADYNTFAVAILKPVSKLTSIDEAGAYAIASEEGDATPSNLVSLGTALFAKYKTAQGKITQGILASIPATSGSLGADTSRSSLVGLLTSANYKDIVSIDQGATFVDPYLADSFTTSAFNSLLGATSSAKVINADAEAIATAVGETLGADGDDLTDVAVVYENFIQANSLSAASAATFATDLINGAVKGLPTGTVIAYSETAVGAGGLLNGGKTGITHSIVEATVNDLASIVDSLAAGIIADSSLSSDTSDIAKDVGALIKGVAGITKDETFSYAANNTTSTVDVAAYLAGSLASEVAGLTSGTEQTAIDGAIDSSLKSVVNTPVFAQVSAEVASPTYAKVGEIVVDETAVTNL